MSKKAKVQFVDGGDWVEVDVPNFYDPERHHTVRLGANDKKPYAMIDLGNGRVYDKIHNVWVEQVREEPGELYKLNLGCGKDIRFGYVNIDKMCGDVVLDLEDADLPFKNESVSEVVACHVMEHLHNFPALMNEIHRVLIPGGTVEIRVPLWTHKEAYQDPTHVRYFTDTTFSYFHEKGTYWREHGEVYGFKPFRHLVQSINSFELKALLRK